MLNCSESAKVFQPLSVNFSSPEDTSIGEALTHSAVQEEFERISAAREKKQKRYMAVSDE